MGQDSPTKICTINGCDRHVRARGMCSTHYNKTLPNRHAKVTVPCDACGAPCVKEKRSARYAHHYCSELCRDWSRGWTLACVLPREHWALMYAATCQWSAPASKPAFRGGSCTECGNAFVEMTGNVPSTWCSDSCQRRVARRTRRAREVGASGSFHFTDVMRQYQRQGMVCAYCGQKPNGLPEPEHVIPLSRGGSNAMSNIVAACHECNAQKADRTPSEWHAYRRERGLTDMDVALTGPAYTHLVLTTPTPRRITVLRAT